MVCEGQTERNYFEALRRELVLQPVNVQIADDNDSAPIAVVRAAIRLRDERASQASEDPTFPPFDEVWCVFDVEDRDRNTSLHAAVELAVENNLHLAMSNSCFEVWVLLHFELHNRVPGAATQVLQKVKAHILGYAKGMEGLCAILRDHSGTATSRAKASFLAKNSGPEDVLRLNPSTRVYELVETFFALAAN